MRIQLACLIAVLGAAPAVAFADTAEPIDAAALDADGKIAAGLDFRFGTAEEDGSSAVLFLFDLNGRVPVTPNLLFHARLPFEVSSFEFLGSDQDASSLGNLEVGGRYAGRARQLRYGLGVRLALPTAADDGEAGLGNIFAGAYIATIDLARYLPNTTAIGFDASVRWTDGRVFLHGEIDLDFLLLQDSDDNQIFYLRLLAGALVPDNLTLMAGFHNAFFLDAPLGADDSVHSLAAGGTLSLRSADLSAYLFFPLDDFADPWGFGVNAAARF